MSKREKKVEIESNPYTSILHDSFPIKWFSFLWLIFFFLFFSFLFFSFLFFSFLFFSFLFFSFLFVSFLSFLSFLFFTDFSLAFLRIHIDRLFRLLLQVEENPDLFPSLYTSLLSKAVSHYPQLFAVEGLLHDLEKTEGETGEEEGGYVLKLGDFVGEEGRKQGWDYLESVGLARFWVSGWGARGSRGERERILEGLLHVYEFPYEVS